MHPDWARSAKDGCLAAAIPFLFKQWGEWMPALEKPAGDWKPIGMSEACERIQIWEDREVSLRVGKHKSGRLLDGIEWNQFPAMAA